MFVKFSCLDHINRLVKKDASKCTPFFITQSLPRTTAAR